MKRKPKYKSRPRKRISIMEAAPHIVLPKIDDFFFADAHFAMIEALVAAGYTIMKNGVTIRHELVDSMQDKFADGAYPPPDRRRYMRVGVYNDD
jgi:hypothetical protein